MLCLVAGCSNLSPARRDRLPQRKGVTVSVETHRRQELELALQKNPGHIPVLLQLAQLESESGQLKKAEDHLLKILRIEPSSVEARLELGKVQFQLGDVAHALENTGAILKVNPEQRTPCTTLGLSTATSETTGSRWNIGAG
jgi:thioredoxin-like negative regulator of GroEL